MHNIINLIINALDRIPAKTYIATRAERQRRISQTDFTTSSTHVDRAGYATSTHRPLIEPPPHSTRPGDVPTTSDPDSFSPMTFQTPDRVLTSTNINIPPCLPPVGNYNKYGFGQDCNGLGADELSDMSSPPSPPRIIVCFCGRTVEDSDGGIYCSVGECPRVTTTPCPLADNSLRPI